MNQTPWGLGFSLFVGHRRNTARMTLMYWQTLARSCRVWSWNHLHTPWANPRWLGEAWGTCPCAPGILCPRWRAHRHGREPLSRLGKSFHPWHGFEKGEMLSIWSIVYHLLLVAMLQRGRKGGVLTRVVRKNRQYFFVYFTGSFFIIIYLKCTRGEDNLWTHPENSKWLLRIWHLK